MEDAVSTNTSTAESVIYDSSSSEGDDEFMLFKMEYPPASTLADSRDFDRILDSLDDDEADDGPYNILMEFAKVAQHYSSSDDDSGSVSSIESETASPSTAESELDDSPLAASLTPKLFKEEKGENPLFFDIEFGDSDHLVVTTPEEMKLNEETHSNTLMNSNANYTNGHQIVYKMSRRQFLDYLKKSKLGVFADHDASSSNTKKNVVFDKIEFDDGTVEHLPRKREGRWFPITGHMIFTV